MKGYHRELVTTLLLICTLVYASEVINIDNGSATDSGRITGYASGSESESGEGVINDSEQKNGKILDIDSESGDGIGIESVRAARRALVYKPELDVNWEIRKKNMKKLQTALENNTIMRKMGLDRSVVIPELLRVIQWHMRISRVDMLKYLADEKLWK